MHIAPQYNIKHMTLNVMINTEQNRLNWTGNFSYSCFARYITEDEWMNMYEEKLLRIEWPSYLLLGELSCIRLMSCAYAYPMHTRTPIFFSIYD